MKHPNVVIHANTRTILQFGKWRICEPSCFRKFAHDEELSFKINARRNKLVGQWAAEKMGLTPEETTAYATAVVQADFEEAGDEDVIRKVMADFAGKQVDQSEHQLRRTMDELMVEAVAQIKAS